VESPRFNLLLHLQVPPQIQQEHQRSGLATGARAGQKPGESPFEGNRPEALAGQAGNDASARQCTGYCLSSPGRNEIIQSSLTRRGDRTTSGASRRLGKEPRSHAIVLDNGK